MNIFFLDKNNKKCVKLYVNKHVVKMILEHLQLLCSVHHICNQDIEFPKYTPPYKLTHKNHPCAKWIRNSLENYLYIIDLTKELCKEYTFRYNKIHKCEQYLKELEENLPSIPSIGFTLPALAMPDEYKYNNTKILDDVVESYRQYYFFEKRHIFDWKNRPVPDFIKEYEDMFES